MSEHSTQIAIWALTSGGVALAAQVQHHFPDSALFFGRRAGDSDETCFRFDRLADALSQYFHQFEAHIFIMATGIVVRSIAGFLRHKTEDPAVVVLDECGQYAISLLSGHLGGANELARRIGNCTGAKPVITTATDLHAVPAIDLIAQKRRLAIENPDAIRHVSMALLQRQMINIYDPGGYLFGVLPDQTFQTVKRASAASGIGGTPLRAPGVAVDDIQIDLPDEILILRPASLFVGVGCNRHTPASEIQALLERVLGQSKLAIKSLAGLASIDIKADEEGLLEVAEALMLPLVFFSRDQLDMVQNIQTPSKMVEKHVGVKSVCEAAAILASDNGSLIVPKQTTPNVTIAIARKSYTSSDWGQDHSSISRPGPGKC